MPSYMGRCCSNWSLISSGITVSGTLPNGNAMVSEPSFKHPANVMDAMQNDNISFISQRQYARLHGRGLRPARQLPALSFYGLRGAGCEPRLRRLAPEMDETHKSSRGCFFLITAIMASPCFSHNSLPLSTNFPTLIFCLIALCLRFFRFWI